MTPATVKQYQKEERSLIANRLRVERYRVLDLINAMIKDTLAFPEQVKKLRKDLAKYYDEKAFLSCTNMGEIVKLSLWMVIKKPDLYGEK